MRFALVNLFKGRSPSAAPFPVPLVYPLEDIAVFKKGNGAAISSPSEYVEPTESYLLSYGILSAEFWRRIDAGASDGEGGLRGLSPFESRLAEGFCLPLYSGLAGCCVACWAANGISPPSEVIASEEGTRGKEKGEGGGCIEVEGDDDDAMEPLIQKAS